MQHNNLAMWRSVCSWAAAAACRAMEARHTDGAATRGGQAAAAQAELRRRRRQNADQVFATGFYGSDSFETDGRAAIIPSLRQ